MIRLTARLAFVALLTAPSYAAEVQARPNVLLIVVDDLGWRDLGCYGGSFAPTPAIDRLASEGWRFTQGYVDGAPTVLPAGLA